MNNQEIETLQDYVSVHGGVYWQNLNTQAVHRVVAIQMKWIEHQGDPDCPAEPAAHLAGGGSVALLNVDPIEFVTLTRIFEEE